VTGAGKFSSSVQTGTDFTIKGTNTTNNTETSFQYFRDGNGNELGAIVGKRGADGNAGSLNFYTSNFHSLGLTINPSGNVGIGTSSPNTTLEVVGGNNLPPSTGTQNYTLALRDPTSMVAGVGGSIILQGFKTSTSAIGNFAYITGKKENGTAGNESGFLSFGTFDSSGNPAERMRITSGGNVLIGKTNDTTPAETIVGLQITTGARILCTVDNSYSAFSRLNADGDIITFHRGTTTKVGSISVTTSATGFNTSSDYRLKQDFKSINGLDLINKINVYNYEWKSDKTRMDGVIAHELQEVLPYAVTGVKDGKEMQGVDYSKLVPVLVKAIQELSAENNTLKEILQRNNIQ
jgi:hypothetical protein